MKNLRIDTNVDYKEFVKTVLDRDNHTCQMPYCDHSKYVVVHHIKRYAKSPTLRTNADNGITLCKKCHKSVFGKEKHYAPMFLRIIASK